jgi:glyoxylase-like metal-dependent hydrolase (beta-lactamase superfamily II)
MSETAVARWTDLGGGVRVRQSRAYWMNSTVLLDRAHTVVVDPGVLPSEIEDIAAVVKSASPERVSIFFTHGHWDHVLGRPFFPRALTIAHRRAAETIAEEVAKIRKEADDIAAEHGERWPSAFEPFQPDLAIVGNQKLQVGPWLLELYAAPGHCDSQLAAHLPARRLLIAADMLSDIEIPLLDARASVYKRTLEGLRGIFERGEVELLIPGHGAIADRRALARERLERDLEYLATLESRCARARLKGTPLEALQEELSAMDYVGKGAQYSMDQAHRRNVKFAYEGRRAAASS